MLDAPILQLFYEKVVRLAIQDTFNSFSHTKSLINGLPVSYNAFLTSMRDENGQFRNSGVSIPKECSYKLFQKIRFLADTLTNIELFRDCFFMVYAKGLKFVLPSRRASQESPSYDAISQVFPLFGRLMNDFPTDCFVDTALTLTKADEDLEELKSTFFTRKFLNKFMANMPLGNLSIDSTCNFYDLCGFRAPMRKAAKKSNHCLYVQVYYNEKNVLAKNGTAQRLVKFNEVDALSNTKSYQRNLEHMRTTLQGQQIPHFGARIEIRTSAVAFKAMATKEFKPFLKILKSVEVYLVPTFAFISFKIISLDIYSFLIKQLSERYIEKTEHIQATARVFCILLEGLVSRIDDWSISRKLLQDLNFRTMHPEKNYVFFDDTVFDHDSLLFRFSDTAISDSQEVSLNLKATMTLVEIVDLLIDTYYRTVWEYLAKKFTHVTVQRNTASYPPVNEQSLMEANVPVHILSGRRNAVNAIDKLFQFNPTTIPKRGMQNWKNLPVSKLMSTLRAHLDSNIKAELINLLVLHFKRNRMIIPAFNEKQFWITKTDVRGIVCVHFVRLIYE